MNSLPDYIKPGVQILLVGINPGLRSAELGHHFAGHSNRFWKLLYESRLVPEPLGFLDDWRLPEWGLGLTNMVPRPTAGCSDLDPKEIEAAWDDLRNKVERFQPEILTVLGVTLGQFLASRLLTPKTPHKPAPTMPKVGLQPFSIGRSRIFILPNPSGRNAHYSYSHMLSLYQELRHLQHS